MGVHGEPGVLRRKLAPADEVTDLMAGYILDDLPFRRGDEVVLLVNNLGSTASL